MSMSPYPSYSPAERIADAIVHLLGLIAAVIGVVLVFMTWADRMETATRMATMVYAAALILMLSASMVYHMAAHTAARPLLRRLDHAAIYLKIAGTFTPLSVLLGTAFGYAILACVWGLALLGASAKLLTAQKRFNSAWLPYVALAWIGVAIFVPLTEILPTLSLALIAGGGVLYMGGVRFYCWQSLRFSNAIWHSFVIAASACFFAGIANALAATL